MNKVTVALVCLVSAVVAQGCAVHQQFSPLPPTFLEGAPLDSSISRVPFKHAWASSEKVTQKITGIYVQPIRTDKLPPDAWLDSSGLSITSSDNFKKEVDDLALFFHRALVEELQRVFSEHPRLKVVSAPSPDAVNLEIAITEVTFSRPVSNIAAMAAPVPGAGIALSAMTQPSVAFAGRFTSPDGRVLLGTVADRRTPQMRPIDLNKFTVQSSARDVVLQWARELAEAIEFNRLMPVDRSSRFSLLPW